jgi:hypothetical protein
LRSISTYNDEADVTYEEQDIEDKEIQQKELSNQRIRVDHRHKYQHIDFMQIYLDAVHTNTTSTNTSNTTAPVTTNDLNVLSEQTNIVNVEQSNLAIAEHTIIVNAEPTSLIKINRKENESKRGSGRSRPRGSKKNNVIPSQTHNSNSPEQLSKRVRVSGTRGGRNIVQPTIQPDTIKMKPIEALSESLFHIANTISTSSKNNMFEAINEANNILENETISELVEIPIDKLAYDFIRPHISTHDLFFAPNVWLDFIHMNAAIQRLNHTFDRMYISTRFPETWFWSTPGNYLN